MRSRNSLPRAREKELTVKVPDPATLMQLVGETDCHLREIQQELDIFIGRDGESLLLRGQDAEVELARDLLLQLKGLIESGQHIFEGDVTRALRILAGNRRVRLDEVFRDQLKVAGKKFTLSPKSINQREYLEAVNSFDLVFGVGPAGCGKTFLAMGLAVASLMRKEVKRVVLCRPAVEAGEKLGFLPGDMAEKVNPYLRPLYDALYEMVEMERVKELLERGVIEVAPLAFMRGRTLSNAFVILDEAQNTTPGQMKMFLTRLGFGTKCYVTGDITQIDLPYGQKSGLLHAVDVLGRVEGIKFVTFNKGDVIRHPLVSRIVHAYEESESKGKSSSSRSK